MAERSKRTSRLNTGILSTLIKANVASNDTTHRVNVPKVSDKSKSSQEQQRSKNNEQSTISKPLLECISPAPLLTSKPYEKSITQRRRKNKPFDDNNLERSNDDQVYRPEISPGKIEIGRSTIDIRQPISEHLFALTNAFNRILSTKFLSENNLQQRRLIYLKLREIIPAGRTTDCQVNLYGSILFECCLDKPCILDIDVQFKDISYDESLRQILEILKKSDIYKDAAIDAETRPSLINLITNEPQMRVRITSGYHRGINLSKLIRIYTKFDERVLLLLRLFRILAKTCNTDKPEIGTLHPVVFHMMVIHFLQQVEPPVLPCLHEYAYGIDNVPVTLDENQYPEFFRVCKNYSREWQRKNQTSIEILFLQLLSYYVKTFCAKQFVVSIQTRMPVMKIDKNWRSRKLLIEDPTDVKRNLCHTMSSVRSNDYFRDTLNAALNYFGRKQKKPKNRISNKSTIENTDEDIVEIINDDEENLEIPQIEQANLLHNSYKLFYKKLPPTVARDANIKQGRVREYYRNILSKDGGRTEGIIQLNFNKNKFDDLDENDIEHVLQQGLEDSVQITEDNDDEEDLENEEEDEEQCFEDANDIEQNEISGGELLVNNHDELQHSMNSEISTIVNGIEKDPIDDKTKETNDNVLVSSDDLPMTKSQPSSSSSPVDIKSSEIISDPLPSPFSSPVKFESILKDQSSTTTQDTSEYFYDFRPENFHAEQGAPYVCTMCNGVGHLKNECPTLVLPNLVPLPSIDEKWLNLLSQVCEFITDRCKPKKNDIENRENILAQLRERFEKDHPDCQLHAFGSFYNGFGFQKSDLDVCLVFKDEREQRSDQILAILNKILRAMKSSNIFENVQPVLNAKVPIIRSRHRQSKIEIDISLHNMLAIENTKLLRTYADIDPRVSQLGYMLKHLAKTCDIGDASRGTLSSYAYIIMLIHFLQQIQPPVLPVLQELSDDPKNKSSMYKKCSKWNVYFYHDLTKIKEKWQSENHLSAGALWIELIRFYTEQFNYDEHVVTIRKKEPLLKYEKGWFRQTIAIEDPFELSHNLAGGLPPRNWMLIRRVFIRARQQFSIPPSDMNNSETDVKTVEELLFNVDVLCPENAPKRCEWCRGPYHIRKRCPAFATMTNEKQRRKRSEKTSQHNWSMDSFSSQSTNQFAEDSSWSLNSNYNHHPKSAPVDQPHFQYGNSKKFSNQSMEHKNKNSYRNHAERTCYTCRQPGHVKADCPFRENSNRTQTRKPSS